MKQARERRLVPNARERVGFADGWIKVFEKLCGQNLSTKSTHKKADKRLNMYLFGANAVR
jgi:hypothetical protein